MIKYGVGEILQAELSRAQSRVDAIGRELAEAETAFRTMQRRYNEARGRLDDLLVTLSEDQVETLEQAIDRKAREQEARARPLPGGRS